MKRFDREARCASLLNHPNVVTIFDVGPSQGEGLPYIVLEYVDGRTFRQIVDSEGPLAFDRALELVAQVAQGLSRAHAAGIVHRDVKPANLMCTSSGVVKILDFGLAKLVQSCFAPAGESQTTAIRPNDITGAHALVGTPQYMLRSRRTPDSDVAYLMLSTATALPRVLAHLADDDRDVLFKAE